MQLGIRVLLHALRKPFMPPLKEGRRSANRRTPGSAPPHKKKACQRMRRAPSLSPQQCGIERRRARLSAPHRGLRRGPYLGSVPGRASWNHRIQTGGPSPAPVQPAPGSPVTRPTVDAQNRPDARCIAAPPGTAPAPPRSTLAKASFVEREEWRIRHRNEDKCQDHVSVTATSLGPCLSRHPRLVDEPWPNGAQ